MMQDPLAFFITWTVYGSHLQGDRSGWRRHHGGYEPAQPALEKWHRERLKHSVKLLDSCCREVCEHSIASHCELRGWELLAVEVRSNHVHAVVSAANASGAKVRDQLKASCTRELRAVNAAFVDRPVWSRAGDWKCVWDDEALEEIIAYVKVAQDRKGADR